jgi:Fe-S-cluster-containing dehydrogenase component
MTTLIQQHAFLFDASRCIDCRACMVSCSVENSIPMNKTRIWVSGVGVQGTFPELHRSSMVYHCMHCNQPSCLSACPVGAYTKLQDGPVLYDHEKCIGCRYCMNACPFGVPHFDYDMGVIEGAFIDKCMFCTQRIDNGQAPACVATCPTDALEYGDRDDLLARAHARIEEHPGRYIDHVYGETENGGTSYLILSHVPFEELGLPAIGSQPVSQVSQQLVDVTLPFALTWGAALAAVSAGVKYMREQTDPNAQQNDLTEEPEEQA